MKTYDLLIMQGISPTTGEVSLEFGNPAFVCTGVQKALQTFLILLLTERGSVESDPLRGTTMLSAVNAGYVRDENLLRAQFLFAVLDIQEYVQNNLANAAPEERFASAELLSWLTTGDTLIMKVRVFTAAGDSVTYTASIPYIPKKGA